MTTTGYTYVGKPIGRIEGPDKVTGAASYSADILLPGMLSGKALRSPYTHARILSIDTSRAKRLPGVHAVLTAADVSDALLGRRMLDMPILARDRVRFIGKVEDFAEIPAWYRAMTLVAVPPWVEGFGLTCLEAMASGCAVVASQTGVFPEVIEAENNGWLIPCRDGEALRATLEDILTDPDNLAQVGQRARQHIERHFTIEREAEGLAKVYDELFARLDRDSGSPGTKTL